MNSEEQVAFGLPEATELGTALCALTADEIDARILLIKGLIANAHGLRKNYQPADVDLLVDPSQYSQFLDALAARGWVRRFTRSVPGVLPNHSTTLVHPTWPCDIDVHWYFPGFFADPEIVFRTLWDAKDEMTFAHVRVPTVNLAGSVAIGCLHALRNPHSTRHQAELQSIVDLLSGARADLQQDVLQIAQVCNAQATLSPVLHTAGAVAQHDLTARESALWDLYTSTNEDGATSAWMLALLTQRSPLEVFRTFRRAILPRPNDVRAEVGRGVTDARSLRRYYVSRFRRASQAMPTAVRAIAQYRSSAKSETTTDDFAQLPAEPTIVVGLATAGRPAVAADLIQCLEASTVDFHGIICAPTDEDVPSSTPAYWSVITGTRGLAAQRNAILAAVGDRADIVAFFDDDAIPRKDYLEVMIQALREHPTVVAATGNVLLDGAPAPNEVPLEDALLSIERSQVSIPTQKVGAVDDRHRKLYGCNFVLRWDALKHMTFDDRLPLYSWLEDYDFALRALRYGRLARVQGAVIVHRGAKSGGRTNHLRFGYSQVMNPTYFLMKKSFTLRVAAVQIFRPVAKNLLLSLSPSSTATARRLRTRGNLLAMTDILRRRVTPERIIELGND